MVLSAHLRKKHALEVQELSDGSHGTVILANKDVKFRLFPGWPKDPYVEVSVSFTDPDVLGSEKSLRLWRFIHFSDGWDFFPIRYPNGYQTNFEELNRNYLFVGSPFLLQEIFAFLTALGQPLFEVNRSVLKDFLRWQAQKNREYNDWATGKSR